MNDPPRMNHPEYPVRRLTIAYTAPFLVFIGVMAIEKAVDLPVRWLYPIRFICALLTLAVISRRVISYRPSRAGLSILVGVLAFLIWIGPDVLFGYRWHWMFNNSLVGSSVSSIPANLRHDPAFALLRAVSCSFLVPLVEELFWRGWLLRWLVAKDFWRVPYEYVPSAFWIVVVLFASEHGPYWEVGAIAGIIYNWLVLRTRNLADCIWAHSITNLCLSVYVLATGRWEYWL
jgi:hypothetical protein